VCLIFELLLKIVKRSNADPGESGAKQDIWYYSDVGAVFGVLLGPRYFLKQNIFSTLVCDWLIFGTLVCDWLIFGTPT